MKKHGRSSYCRSPLCMNTIFRSSSILSPSYPTQTTHAVMQASPTTSLRGTANAPPPCISAAPRPPPRSRDVDEQLQSTHPPQHLRRRPPVVARIPPAPPHCRFVEPVPTSILAGRPLWLIPYIHLPVLSQAELTARQLSHSQLGRFVASFRVSMHMTQCKAPPIRHSPPTAYPCLLLPLGTPPPPRL